MLLHPCHVLVDVGGIDDQEELLGSHLVDQQVVDGAAVGVAHHAVEDLPIGGVFHIVGEDMVDVALGIRTSDEHFAHVAHVEDAAGLTYCLMLVGDV